MKQVDIKEVPLNYIKKLKIEYILNKKKQYKLMGINFNLTETEVNEDVSYFFSKCLFFYDPFFLVYFYSSIKKLT
tara:strand:+ start:265 stop:489 length:225 start_codon:yes stop_codon:yes gene_type:complete